MTDKRDSGLPLTSGTYEIDRRQFLGGAIAALALTSSSSKNADTRSPVQVVGLKVDGIVRPLGLETLHPQLSWRLQSAQRNVRQTAYRVLVADSAAAIRSRVGNLWDSGKVRSSTSLGVQYQGNQLTSRQKYWWRVRVWNEEGQESDYSEESFWEMGLLSLQDWSAQWLAVEDAVSRADRESGLHWIGGSTLHGKISRKFRLSIEVPDAVQTGALIVGAMEGPVGVWIDGHSVGTVTSFAKTSAPPATIHLPPLSAGKHVIGVEVHPARRDGKDTTSTASVVTAFMRLELTDGRLLRFIADHNWRTSLSEEADWCALDYNDARWERAAPSPIQSTQAWPPSCAMHLRREFRTENSIIAGRLYVTALGAYEARLNGRRIGDGLLAPERSQYNRRVLYRVHDVTELIKPGGNVLGLTVGDGWYAGSRADPFGGRYLFGPPPRRVLAQLELTLADGSRQVVCTGPGWRIAQSPILRSEIYDGEVYDATLEQPGWDTAGFDDSHWQTAEEGLSPPCRLSANVCPPVRATEILKALRVTNPAPGAYVFDFGQNFAGWCRLRVTGSAGSRIEMRFSELLTPSGEADQSNLASAKQTDLYTLRGDPAGECFEPHFTYHGFRYVQITGLPLAPTTDTLEGVVLHTDLDVTGQLRVDNPLIEQIWRNTVWTQRSNFIGIPTDDCQRSERMGVLGDAGIFWDAAAFNMDIDAFTRRQMENATDAQNPNGSYPHTAPIPAWQGDPYPAWSDGALILTWTAWHRYGDVEIIKQNWDGMSRYLNLILAANPNYLWRNKRQDVGDWLSVDEKYIFDPTTPNDLIATAYWSHSTDLLAQMAYAVNRIDDGARLHDTHRQIRAAFAQHFVTADGRVGNESQTSYILALKLGLIPESLRQRAADRLAADVCRRGGALSTGILGTQYILDVLADSGYATLAYSLLLRADYPSWGYMISKGATTIWESWNEKVWTISDDGKSTAYRNSYNHYALGAIGGFLFRRTAGIDLVEPGFAAIRIRPVLDSRIQRAGADYEAVVGRISTDWAQMTDGSFTLDVTVPANATAQIYLPARRSSLITEGRQDIFRKKDIQLVRYLKNEAVIAVGSGSFKFAVEG